MTMVTNKSVSDQSPELAGDAEWLLRLYVTMQTPNSIMAFTDLKEICKAGQNHKYEIELINLLRGRQLSHDHQILPTAKLLGRLPRSFRVIIQDLCDRDNVLVGIDLTSRS